MRYYVIGDDGSKYGPADVATLNAWIQEGRLLSKTLLEEEASGTRIAAGAVQELTFPPAAAPAAPGSPEAAAPASGPYANATQPTTGPYAKGPYNAGPIDDGKGFVVGAWILSGFGLLGCCVGGFVLAGIGLILAIVANGKGNASAKPAIICSAIVLVISLATTGWWVNGIITNMPKIQQEMKRQQQQQMQQHSSPGSPGSAATTGQ